MKLGILVFIFFIGSVSAHGAESPYKIRIGFPSLAFSYLPFYVAQEKGIYKKYGIESEYIQMGTTIQPQAVVGGNINYFTSVSTGISAAVALSQRVLSGESESVHAYLNFLRSGGSKFPLETLKAAGVDMATPAPIESTLRLFESRLAELEELLL